MNDVVVAAIDNSAAAAPVLSMALAVAPVLGARVEAVHIIDEQGTTAEASAEARGVPYVAIPGDPLERLVEVAGAADVAALTLGIRSRPRAGRPPGHLAPALASRIDKPVIAVPPEAEPPERLQRVLIATEGTPAKARTLKRTVELAAAVGLDFVVVHVEDEASIPMFSDQVHHEAEAYTREFLARFVPGAPEATLQLRTGVPADEILAAAEEIDAHLLAVGWPHTTDPERGLVARAVLDRSHRPVLLVALA